MKKPDPAKLPEFMTRVDADAAFGAPAAAGTAARITFEREMADLCDKMTTELMAVFDDTHIELDFSDESLEALDDLADQLWPEPVDAEAEDADPEALDAVVANWGAYLGLTIRENIGGEWTFRQDLEHASLHFPRLDIEAFPMHAMRRRLALGPGLGSRLSTFYERLVAGLLEEE